MARLIAHVRTAASPPEDESDLRDGEQAVIRGRFSRQLQQIWVTFFALAIALAIGAILIVLTDQTARDAWGSLFQSPGHAVLTSFNLVSKSYAALFNASFGSEYAISETLTAATPLLLTALCVTLAFRAGLFNIGVQSQFTAGAVAATYVGFSLSGWPVPIHLALALTAAVVAGGLMGIVPAVLKVKTNSHEVITCLMLNYIAQFVATWLVATSVFAAVGQGGAISKPVNVSLPHLLGAGNRVHLGTVLALVAGVAVWYVLTRTTLGFRVDVVGSNRVAARYAGINVSRTYIWVFAASGALAGLAGAGEILGVQGFLSADIGSTFTLGAIAVALLGRLQPIGVVFASLLLGALQAGAIGMQSVTGVPVDIIQVLEALIIVLVAAPLFLREVFHIRAQGATAIEGGELSKGWAG